MTYQPQSDYNLEVLRGNIAGHSMVNIRGHDDTVPMGGPFGLSGGFGGASYQFDQSAIARGATPAVVGVASTDNTKDNVGNVGALTVRVFGLDANGDEQTNDVTLTGQTAVNTASTFSAVHQVLVLTTGSENANAGRIWVGTGTFTAGVPAVRMLSMDIKFNVSLSAYYVVPLGASFFVRQFVFTIQTGTKEASVNIETSPDGIQWTRQIEFGLEGGSDNFDVIALPGFVTGTHVRLRATGTAASTAITAIVAGELVDD